MMIESLPTNTRKSFSLQALDVLTNSDPKVAMALGGLFCVTTLACLGLIVFTGYELNLSQSGLSLTTTKKDKHDM